jgi:hypothetical protein
MPEGGAELWPRIHGRESNVSVKPSFIIPNTLSNSSEPSEWNSISNPLEKVSRFSEGTVDGPTVQNPLEEEAEVQ